MIGAEGAMGKRTEIVMAADEDQVAEVMMMRELHCLSLHTKTEIAAAEEEKSLHSTLSAVTLTVHAEIAKMIAGTAESTDAVMMMMRSELRSKKTEIVLALAAVSADKVMNPMLKDGWHIMIVIVVRLVPHIIKTDFVMQMLSGKVMMMGKLQRELRNLCAEIVMLRLAIILRRGELRNL